VLSDPIKRQAYDAGGHAGVSQRWSADDLFRDFDFGDLFTGRFADLGGIFSELFPGSRRAGGKPRGVDLRFELRLSLDEAARGGERLVEIRKTERCRSCGGTGAAPGTEPVRCADCDGTGKKQKVTTEQGMKVITLTTCNRCGGRGTWIASPCAACGGSGTEFLPHKIKVRVPPGVDDGTLLRIPGQGEPAPSGGTPGNLYFEIAIDPHPTLRREGDDLYTVASVDFVDMALGSEVTVGCLQGETVRVKVPAGTQSGTVFRVRGKGILAFMPRRKAIFLLQSKSKHRRI
jgi:molecular chaperone DnaJ